jgi:hypothetical protein
MKLTGAEIEYTRRVAAEIGVDPETLIAKGEQLKEEGYRRAYQASVEILGGGRSNQMIGPRGGPALEASATIEPELLEEPEAEIA